MALSMISTLMGASHLALRMSFTRYLGAKFTLHLRWGLCSHSTHCGSKHPNDLQQEEWQLRAGLRCGTSTGRMPVGPSSLQQQDCWPQTRLRASTAQAGHAAAFNNPMTTYDEKVGASGSHNWCMSSRC